MPATDVAGSNEYELLLSTLSLSLVLSLSRCVSLSCSPRLFLLRPQLVIRYHTMPGETAGKIIYYTHDEVVGASSPCLAPVPDGVAFCAFAFASLVPLESCRAPVDAPRRLVRCGDSSAALAS